MNVLDYYFRKLEEKHMLIGRTDSKGSAVLLVVGFISSASMVVFFHLQAAWEQYLFASLYCLSLFLIICLDIFKVILPRVRTKVLNIEGTKDFEKAIVEDTYKEIRDLEEILKKKNKYLKIIFCLLIFMTATLVASIICAVG